MKKINQKCIVNIFTSVEYFKGFSKTLLNFHPPQQINKQARRMTTVNFCFNNVACWPLGFPAYWITSWHRNVSCLQQSWRKISSLITILLQLSLSWTSKLFRLLEWIVCVVRQSSKALACVCLTDYHLQGRKVSFCQHNLPTVLHFHYIVLHADCHHGVALTKEWTVGLNREKKKAGYSYPSVLLPVCCKSPSSWWHLVRDSNQ